MDELAQFDGEIDARGLNCPLPILRTKKALSVMESGKILRILATDRGAVRDFQAFAKQTGNELISFEESEECLIFHLRKR
jgi:tRNA 2-thiouridine synthesizing protein A